MATVLVKYNQIVKYALNFVFISALLVGSISGLLVFNFFFSELAPFTLSFFMPIFFIVGVVVFVLVLLGSIAFCTVYERKAIAVLQNRRGPNRAGFFGLIQALGDGVKLMLKAQISKKQTSLYFFYFAPFSALCLSWFLGFYIMFSSFDDFSIYFFLIWSSLNAYSLPLAGFSTSHSKFALLGGVRSFSQLLSYELCLAVVLLIVVSYTQTPILGEIIQFQIEHKCLLRSLSPVFIVWFISICAETNRVPFDLPEAEAELVAGFATEYASFAFAAFFLAEYGSILVYSYMTSLLFCNIKLSVPCTVFFFFVFSWVRTTLPRYKVDQLLWIGWYVLLPVSLVLFIFYFSNANIIGLLLSDLFNLIGFFFSSVWFFLVGLVKPSSIFLFFLPFGQINNKYQVIQHQNHTYRVGTNRTTKLRWFKRKQDIFTHNTTVDLDRDDSPSFILPLLVGDKQVASSSWLLVPLVTALGSLYHLLAAANGVSYSF